MEPTYTAYEHEKDVLPHFPITYAGFWERFAAAFLDGLILMIPNLVIQRLLGEQSSIVINLVIGWLYSALQESGASQATLGKRAMNIKVTGLQEERISFGQATGRYFGKFVSTLILFIGYLMMLWDDKNQTLHDKMAGTLVIKG